MSQAAELVVLLDMVAVWRRSVLLDGTMLGRMLLIVAGVDRGILWRQMLVTTALMCSCVLQMNKNVHVEGR